MKVEERKTEIKPDKERVRSTSETKKLAVACDAVVNLAVSDWCQT